MVFYPDGRRLRRFQPSYRSSVKTHLVLHLEDG